MRTVISQRINLGKWGLIASLSIMLSGCALSPEQQAAREVARIKAEQALQVDLAKQCDVPTAQLMASYFDPPIAQTESERAEFAKAYQQKVNDPLFQACYKMALENYKMQQEVQQMRYYYDDWRWGRRPWHFCYACW